MLNAHMHVCKHITIAKNENTAFLIELSNSLHAYYTVDKCCD